MKKYSTELTLFVIMLIGLVLRLHNLTVQSLWIDEIVSMVEVDPAISLGEVVKRTVLDQPPAFFISLHGWFKVFDYSEYNGRLFSVLVGIFGIVAMFFLGKEIKDPKVGLLAAFLTSINYINILLSQEIRFYTFLFLFTTLSYLFFIRCVKHSKVIDFVFFSLFTTVVVYSHYYGLVVAASQGLIFIGLLIFYPINKKFIALSILCGIAVIVAFSPWLPVIFSDIQTSDFWIKLEPFYFPVVYFYVYFKDIITCIVFATIILYFLIDVFKRLKQKVGIDSSTFILIGWGVLSYLIPLSYSIIKIPMMQVRYTIIALPCLIIMISVGMFQIIDKWRTVLLIVTSLTCLISLLFIENYYTEPRKEDWRGMITEVINTAAPSDIFVSEYSYYCNYYFKSLHSNLRAVQPENLNLTGEQPMHIWWIEAFDIKPLPIATQKILNENGYVIEKTTNFYNAQNVVYSKAVITSP